MTYVGVVYILMHMCTNVGQVKKKLILVRPSFHKIIYKRVWFSLLFLLFNIISQDMVSIKKIELILKMGVFINLKIIDYSLIVLTNQLWVLEAHKDKTTIFIFCVLCPWHKISIITIG